MDAAVWGSRIEEKPAEPSWEGKASLCSKQPPKLVAHGADPCLCQVCDVESSKIVLGKGLTVFGLLNKGLLCEISYLMNQFFEGTSGPSPGPLRNVSFEA